MERLSFFSALIMAVSLMFTIGCQKDQIVESPQTSSRSVLASINNAPSKIPESHFLFKRPLTCTQNENLPDSTWNPVQLMLAFGVYNQLKCEGGFEITKHGEPIWASTIYFTKEKKKYTITPLEKDGQISTLFSVMEDEASIGFHFLAKSTMSQSEIETYWPQYDGGIKCPSLGKSFFEKMGNFFENLFGSLFDGFGTSSSYQTSSNYYWFYTGGSNESSGGFGNTGGSGGSGTNSGYINPMGGYWNCDIRLQNVEGCRKYFKDNFNFEINDPALEEKIQKCGCYRAVMNTGDWIYKSNGEKCLDCYGGLVSSSQWAYQYDILEQFLNNLEFPCQNVDQREIDKIKDDVYTQACIALYSSTSTFYPGKALTEVLNQLEVKGLTYIARSNKYGKGLAGASISIASMAAILDLTSNEIATLSNEEICRKIQVSECLKPASAGSVGAINNSEKAALLDFYKNADLINPCTGEDIDKDAIFQSMCENGEVSMSGLDEALEGVDAIIVDPTFKNCKALNCIYNKLYDSGSKMFCNNIYKFNYSTAIDLKISVGTPESNADAHVKMVKNGDGVELVFNKFNCEETDHLQLAETMLHESVHAKFRYDHAKNGTTEAEYQQNFLKYVNEKYGISYKEHHVMVKEYMNKLATELWELNGKKYDPSYYMAWVADGLEQYWPEKFSEADKASWKAKRDIVKANNPFKCN